MSVSQLAMVVDGGGTKTDCLILRQTESGTERLARETASGSNPAALGVDGAAEVILSVCGQALATAQVTPGEVTRGAFAIAGTLNPQLRDSLMQRLQSAAVAATCRVFPDILPIALAASQSGPGVALIAGTGSVAASRCADGMLTVLGGWGYLVGDEGSGYWLGRQAARHALRCLERGESASPLVQGVQDSLQASSLAEIKNAIYAAQDLRRNIASLAPVVQQLAGDGDPAALAIIESAVEHLAELVAQALDQLPGEPQGVPVALAGGLLGHQGIVGETLTKVLAKRFPLSKVTQVASPLQACELLLAEPVFNTPLQVAEL